MQGADLRHGQHVVGVFQYPAPRGGAVLQDLQDCFVKGVGRGKIACIQQPVEKPRHAQIVLKAHLGESDIQQQRAFIRAGDVDQMGGVEIFDIVAPLVEMARGSRDARRHGCRLGAGGRAGVQGLPAARRAQLRVVIEEILQEGGAGARQAHQENRAVDGLGEDGRIAGQAGGDFQPVAQQSQDFCTRDRLTLRGERAFGIERLQKLLKILGERIVAECLQAEGSGGLLFQVEGIERWHGRAPAGFFSQLRPRCPPWQSDFIQA